jgi:beta-hydroxylase
MERLIYRIAPPDALAAASLQGAYQGEAFDKADGFIHASSRAQLAGTLAAHYAEAERLAVAVIDADALGDTLRWEVSRGGEKFPHIYGDLPWSAVTTVHLLKKDDEGWRLPEELTA